MDTPKKRVGLITMHRVLNSGSALQAYALQRKVRELGYDCEIIDYIFPNAGHLSRQSLAIRLKRNARSLLSNIFWGFPGIVRKKRFHDFYNRFFTLSPQTYSSCEEIHNHPPAYDIYLTGSDQVWNPRHVKDDTTFFLSFCKEKNPVRASFAASFATSRLPEELRGLYSRHLSAYQHISVREKSGINLVADLTGQKAEVVCDPTLMLNESEWSELAEPANMKIKKPYILAYILTYAFNPHPGIDGLIARIQNHLKLPVVYLNGRLTDYRKKDSRVIKNAGPLEFLWLFKNADFVITTSLHGTAFAVNFSKPFYSVVADSQKDSRISSLLQLVGAQDRAIDIINSADMSVTAGKLNLNNASVSRSLDELRKNSLTFLNNALAMGNSRQ